MLHDLTNIVELLAQDYDATTLSVPGIEDKVMITTGMTVAHIAVYVGLSGSGTVEVYWLDLDLEP